MGLFLCVPSLTQQSSAYSVPPCWSSTQGDINRRSRLLEYGLPFDQQEPLSSIRILHTTTIYGRLCKYVSRYAHRYQVHS